MQLTFCSSFSNFGSNSAPVSQYAAVGERSRLVLWRSGMAVLEGQEVFA